MARKVEGCLKRTREWPNRADGKEARVSLRSSLLPQDDEGFIATSFKALLDPLDLLQTRSCEMVYPSLGHSNGIARRSRGAEQQRKRVGEVESAASGVGPPFKEANEPL